MMFPAGPDYPAQNIETASCSFCRTLIMSSAHTCLFKSGRAVCGIDISGTVIAVDHTIAVRARIEKAVAEIHSLTNHQWGKSEHELRDIFSAKSKSVGPRELSCEVFACPDTLHAQGWEIMIQWQIW
jgi:hypothetical protein